MKKNLIAILCLSLLLTSCASTHQFHGAATGSYLGGMFGSAIGGIMKGRRGSHAGTLIGMVAGGVVGAAATVPKTNSSARGGEDPEFEEDVTYTAPRPRRQMVEAAKVSDFIEVTNVRFVDPSQNQCLNAGETGHIEMEIYNRSERAIHDVTPLIKCNNRHIIISPPAIISRLAPGEGVNYRAAVRAKSKLKAGEAVFSVSFGDNHKPNKQFKLALGR